MTKKSSQWQTEEVAEAFVEGVRGAIPGARLQLEILCRIVLAWRPEPLRILDLGCGDGILGRTLLKEYPRAETVFADFSEPMLDKLRSQLGGTHRTTLVHVDFATSDWIAGVGTERSFDVIVSGFAIHHQPDARKKELYAEIYGLLGPGGVFLNLDQVSSATATIEQMFDSFFLDHIRRSPAHAGSDASMQEIEKAYSQDKKENLPASVEEQCRWLRELGFKEVDCFFKAFELALFGGRRTFGPDASERSRTP